MNLKPWTLSLPILVLAAGLCLGWSRAQEAPKPQKAEVVGDPRGSSRLAAIQRVLPELKTSLSEAVVLAEKELKGKAYSASIVINKTRVLIQVQLFVDGKALSTIVDPETKKVGKQETETEKDG